MTNTWRPEIKPITHGQMAVDWEDRIDFGKMRSERLEKARAAMRAANVDFLILNRIENARYTTSIKRLYWPTIRLGGGPLVVLPQEGMPVVYLMDWKFAANAMSWIPRENFRTGYELDAAHDVEQLAKDLVRDFGESFSRARIGVDIWSGQMMRILPTAFPKVDFVDGQDVMIQARKIKTPEEIACIKMAYVMSEAGMQAALDILKPGVRECELVGACFEKFWDLGAETSQCSECVNSGPGTHPYRRFHTDRIVQAGEMVNMDFGACYNGYFGDFCRGFVCGRKPTAAQLDILRRTYDLLQAQLQQLRPGVTGAEMFERISKDRTVGHGMGHGIGISAFEVPHLRHNDHEVIQPGMVFEVSAGYLGNARDGSVHFEDTVVITESGIELISTFPFVGIDD